MVKEFFGFEDVYDEIKNYMLINDVKIKYVKWLLLWVCLYNVVILCNWVWLMIVLLLKSCNYWGDLVFEVKFFKVIIGEEMI